MIATVYNFTQTDSKTIERILEDDNVGIIHMVLAKGDALPDHVANSHVYLIVIRGKLTIKIEGQEEDLVYPSGSIVNIPFKTQMQPYNQFDEILEFFVVKAPSPRHMPND